MAQGFFKHIPNINYDFKSDGKYYEAKDLFRKVSVWDYLQEGIAGYSYYRITEGERPDVVAAKLYGDSTLYWTFWLVNENLQDHSDWPKSQRLFEKFLDRKYSGKCLVAANSTDIVSYDHSLDDDKQSANRKFVLGEKVSQSSSAYGFVTDVNPTHNRITVQTSSTDSFTIASTVTGATSGKSFTISSIQNERDAANHYLTDVITNAGEVKHTFRTTVPTNNTVVTNEKYELDLNEEKHLIRYIPAHYMSRVVREFVSLVRD
jgi:hypothetical protein